MKRLFAVVVVGALMLWAAPAQAHHSSWDMFLDQSSFFVEGYVWSAAAHNVYFTDELNQKLTTAQFDFAQESFDQALQTWNNNITGATAFNFQYGTAANWNFVTEFENYFPDSDPTDYCNNVPFESGKTLSSVHLEDLGNIDPFYADQPWLVVTCDKDNNGVQDWTAVAFNEDYTSAWHYNDDDTIPSSQQDFRSEATHAWGRSVGIDQGPGGATQQVLGDWNVGSAECAHNSTDYNTICADTWGSHGRRVSMTLNTHDKGALRQGYP